MSNQKTLDEILDSVLIGMYVRQPSDNGLKAQTWTVQEEDGIVYVKRV